MEDIDLVLLSDYTTLALLVFNEAISEGQRLCSVALSRAGISLCLAFHVCWFDFLKLNIRFSLTLKYAELKTT